MHLLFEITIWLWPSAVCSSNWKSKSFIQSKSFPKEYVQFAAKWEWL